MYRYIKVVGKIGGIMQLIKILKDNFEFDRLTLIAYLRFIIGGYFIYASVDKIIDPYSFARMIEAYQFSSYFGLSFLDTSLALILPWLEFLLGFCLVSGFLMDEANNLIILLLVFFIIMLSLAFFRGLDISCGCSSLDTTITDAILIDFVLIFACLLIKFRYVFARRSNV